MEYKSTSSKFMLQTQTKYRISKYKLACKDFYLEKSVISQKIYSAKVSHCQNSNITEVSIVLI